MKKILKELRAIDTKWLIAAVFACILGWISGSIEQKKGGK